MMQTSIDGFAGSAWITVAILAGGFARTRNRSAWYWFLWTLLFGPIAAGCLVIWPARPARPAQPAEAAGPPAVGRAD